MKIVTFQIALLSIVLSGCAGRLISNAQELSLGKGVDTEIRHQYRLVSPRDPVTQWAEGLVAPLAEASTEFRELEEIGGYKVAVIADEELVNAFAAPGGYTYVSTGLILQAKNCAEVAGVMAHELAHVTQRHGAKALEKAFAVEQLTALFLDEGLASDAALTAWRFIQSTKLSRTDEAEADYVGLQITYSAGYDPYGLTDFFETLSADGDDVPEFFSSHPATSARLQAVSSEIESRYGTEFERGDPALTGCKTKMKLSEVKTRIRKGRLLLAKAPVRTDNTGRADARGLRKAEGTE